ncbi:hypothetical protein [Fibrella aestuarina]|uniref:hypothetical protein n=1 Tax=Fibrella aestuarina TaxID=651143 RepID=UPI00031DE2C3|nr:hypothetical protein [Fibrella aestuarina]
MLDSLTALHFRRLEVSSLTRDLQKANDHIDRLAVRLAQCREGATPLAFDAFEAKDRAGLETNRRRRWQAVTILTGAGLVYYVGYRSYKTLSLRWIWTF